jgi:fructose-1,6-bisphosphatase/sedoheptulose 1,7-bisphosphatase-like protein
LNKTPTQNLQALAEAKRCNVEDLTVIILSRPRHEALIKEVRQAGARIRLIGDGDVSAAIATTKPETGIDLLLGIGGAPEGVLAAAALRCVGGEFQGRLAPRNNEEIERAKKMGVSAEFKSPAVRQK